MPAETRSPIVTGSPEAWSRGTQSTASVAKLSGRSFPSAALSGRLDRLLTRSLARQAGDGALIDPAVVEIFDVHAHGAGKGPEPGGGHPVYPGLVLLDLLETDADHFGEIALRQPEQPAAPPQAPADMEVQPLVHVRLQIVWSIAMGRSSPASIRAA